MELDASSIGSSASCKRMGGHGLPHHQCFERRVDGEVDGAIETASLCILHSPGRGEPGESIRGQFCTIPVEDKNGRVKCERPSGGGRRERG